MPKVEKDSQQGEVNLKDNIRKIAEISNWFESQEEIDLEEALLKVREASALIKASKSKLTAVENEFNQIEREMGTPDKEKVFSEEVPF